MDILADESLLERALNGGGYVGIAILIMVLAAVTFAKYVVIPSLSILREMTENCTRAAADNKDAANSHRAAASDLKGTARILEKMLDRATRRPDDEPDA